MNAKLKEKLNLLVKEKKITSTEFKKLSLYASDPWEKVRGILKRKRINPLEYQKKIRQEWEQ